MPPAIHCSIKMMFVFMNAISCVALSFKSANKIRWALVTSQRFHKPTGSG